MLATLFGMTWNSLVAIGQMSLPEENFPDHKDLVEQKRLDDISVCMVRAFEKSYKIQLRLRNDRKQAEDRHVDFVGKNNEFSVQATLTRDYAINDGPYHFNTWIVTHEDEAKTGRSYFSQKVAAHLVSGRQDNLEFTRKDMAEKLESVTSVQYMSLDPITHSRPLPTEITVLANGKITDTDFWGRNNFNFYYSNSDAYRPPTEKILKLDQFTRACVAGL
jgi:hypothetical protein